MDAFKSADQVLLSGVSGHHRPHHDARPDQPRLRRRQVGHVRRRLRPHGHRLGARRGPRGRGRRDGDLQPAARGEHRRRPRRAAVDLRRLRPRPVRDQRGRPAGRARPPTPRPTSSSAPSSTTPSATRCGSPSSRPASTAACRVRCGGWRPGVRSSRPTRPWARRRPSQSPDVPPRPAGSAGGGGDARRRPLSGRGPHRPPR